MHLQNICAMEKYNSQSQNANDFKNTYKVPSSLFTVIPTMSMEYSMSSKNNDRNYQDYQTFCNNENNQWSSKPNAENLNIDQLFEQYGHNSLQNMYMRNQQLLVPNEHGQELKQPYVDSETTYANAKKKKRKRTAYSSAQLMTLEEAFGNGHYLCRSRRIQIANDLQLSEKQIKVWFQNRRMKYKKDEKSKANKSIESTTDISESTQSSSATASETSFESVARNSASLAWLDKIVAEYSESDNLYLHPSITSQNNNQAIFNSEAVDRGQHEGTQEYHQAVIPAQQMQSAYVSQNDTYFIHQQYPQQVDYPVIHYSQSQQNNYFQEQWSYPNMQNSTEFYNPNFFAQNNYKYNNENYILNQTSLSLPQENVETFTGNYTQL